MRSRRSRHSQVAEVARRRLELLSAELAAIRPDPVDPPFPGAADGSGESSPPVRPGAPEPLPPVARPAQSAPSAPAASVMAAPAGRHARRARGWFADRVPPSLQGRVGIGPSQLTVVAVLVAAAFGFLAWWSVRASDPGELVPARAVPAPVASQPAPDVVTPSGPSPPPSSAATVAPPAAGATGVGAVELVVDVAGKVRRPGIVRLPSGARVVDAVEAAGGVRRGADLTGLNLARPLVDGEQVLVGVAPVGGVAPPAAAGPVASPTTALVNLNTATGPELETLPGVGPVTAAAILQWRTDHGAFSAVDELLEVSGIGDATLAEIAPFVTL